MVDLCPTSLKWRRTFQRGAASRSRGVWGTWSEIGSADTTFPPLFVVGRSLARSPLRSLVLCLHFFSGSWPAWPRKKKPSLRSLSIATSHRFPIEVREFWQAFRAAVIALVTLTATVRPLMAERAPVGPQKGRGDPSSGRRPDAELYLPMELVERSVGSRIRVTLRDGGAAVGILRGFDSYANLVLEDVVLASEPDADGRIPQARLPTMFLNNNVIVMVGCVEASTLPEPFQDQPQSHDHDFPPYSRHGPFSQSFCLSSRA